MRVSNIRVEYPQLKLLLEGDSMNDVGHRNYLQLLGAIVILIAQKETSDSFPLNSSKEL